ncbi:hypothetical protein BDC45DRAFT_206440 [Circinella umbellata]|nr:hypothetical protein BDC45DRAFT_206440 [Circinella umbellata]
MNIVVQTYTAELLSVLQLWVMKAPEEAIHNGLSQLVYTSYSAPNDGIFIDAWKNISHGLGSNGHPEAIWIVIKHCSRIMKGQLKLTNELLDQGTEKSEHEVYMIVVKRLSPLLILRTFSQQTYQSVSLPKSIRNHVNWTSLYIDPEKVKWENDDDNDNESKHLALSKDLFEELLLRTQDAAEFQENQALAKTLLTYIYCL